MAEPTLNQIGLLSRNSKVREEKKTNKKILDSILFSLHVLAAF